MMQDDGSETVVKQLKADLQRQANWSWIIPFLEQHSSDVRSKKQQSPATYAKYKRWLLNTEQLTIAQVLAFREFMHQSPMSQGELIRLLGGNPHREGINEDEQKEILALNRYWANQIRNNLRPILADYFGLMEVQWEGDNKPGTGEYSIRASHLLIRFFSEKLYATPSAGRGL